MPTLPWLLAHGARIYEVAFVAFVVIGYGAARALLARAALNHAQERRARFSVDDPEPVESMTGLAARAGGGAVVFAGRLVVVGERGEHLGDGAAVAAATVDGGDAYVSSSAQRLVLELSDAQVELRGPVRVVGGSREQAWRPGASTIAPPPRVGTEKPSLTVRSVSSGERVRVSGSPRTRPPSDAAGSYREPACVSVVEGNPLIVVSQATPRLDLGAAHHLACASLGVLVYLVVFALGGELAFRVARTMVDRDVRGAASPLTTRAAWLLELAAATPLRRDDAVRSLFQAMKRDRPYRSERGELLLDLGALRGDCADRAEMLVETGQLARALVLLEPCRDSRSAEMRAIVRHHLGDFAEASRAIEAVSDADRSIALPLVIEMHVLADRWSLAADKARSRGVSSDTSDETITLRCVGDALDAARGQRFASERLARLARLSAGCAVLDADRSRGSERLAALDRARSLLDSSAVLSSTARLLAAETMPEQAALHDPIADSYPATLVGLHATAMPSFSGLAASALVAMTRADWEEHGATEARATLEMSAASFVALSGDDASAERSIARAYELLVRSPSDRIAVALDLEAALALRRGDLARARRFAREGGQVAAVASFLASADSSAGREDLAAMLEEGGASPAFARSFADAARRGDGDALAEILWAEPMASRFTALVGLVAPRARHGRAALATWNRWAGYYPWGRRVDELVTRLGIRWSVAKALGDDELAAELAPALSKLRAAAMRRDVDVVLRVLRTL